MIYLAAVVPTIDEAETIGELCRSLDRTCDLVIVADNSTESATSAAAVQAGAIVVRPGDGLGPAYKRAHETIHSDWYVVHIDAGGSHDPRAVYEMLELAEEGFDVVVGSRFCNGGEHHGPWRRRVTSKAASGALNLVTFANVDDWTSGYRMYSPKAREIIARHDFATAGHAWQIEALYACYQAGLRIVEIPIVYRSSVSHLSAGRVKEAAGLWWKLAGE